MKIFIPQGFLSAIKGKHLLLDTNFFIENDATLVSIEPVQTEFLKGSPSEDKYKIKAEYFEEIVSNFLPGYKGYF